MKQIKKNTLCYYCLGCNKQESEEYKPVMRCKKVCGSNRKLAREIKRGAKEK